MAVILEGGMQKKRNPVVVMVVVFVLIGVMSACTGVREASPGRQVVALTYAGSPGILRNGDTQWQALQHGVQVYPGDAISTGAASWVFLEINDGSLVGLTPNTTATLVTLSEAMKDPVTLVDLAEGLVYVRVTKELGKGSFEVHTPLVTGSVVGSKMSVQYIPSLNTADVACFEGNVAAMIDYAPQEDPLSCHLISGVKLSPSSEDEVTVKKCQNPVKVSEVEVKAYSDWERMYIDLDNMIQTEQARVLTLTRMAFFTKTPTPTVVIVPTETLIPSITPTITSTPYPERRPTITVDANAELSSAEQANSGVHSYTFTATYSGNCKGPTSGRMDGMEIRFEGNRAILSNGGNRSVFEKVDENTYQAGEGEDLVTMTFTEDGFTGESHCVFWNYTRQ